MDRLSAISDAGGFSAVFLESFSVPLTLGRGQDWAPATELQPYLRKDYKPACLWFLFK